MYWSYIAPSHYIEIKGKAMLWSVSWPEATSQLTLQEKPVQNPLLVNQSASQSIGAS